MILETTRLILRPMTISDFNDLKEVFGDRDTMKYYQENFDDKLIKHWIKANIEREKIFGFSLYSVILKENNKVIGDCGISMQNINGIIKPEIGYHINKSYQCQGYAHEASRRWIDWAFTNTSFKELYSYMVKENIPSIKTAIKNQMKYCFEFIDSDGPTVVYKITKEEFIENEKKEKIV